MKTARINLFVLSLFASLLLAVSCKEKKQELKSESVSYVVSDSLQAWCKSRLPENRMSYEGSTIKLLFFEEELNVLWRPAYNEETVKEIAGTGNFQWQELPVHEGNRRWEMSLPLQPEDSTYATPNNLLLYLFR